MGPSKTVFFLLLSLLLFSGEALAQKKVKSKKIEREFVGAEMEFGRKAAMSGLWNEAIFRWEKVIKSDPNNPDALNNLAVAYESVGNYDRASELYDKALALDEDSQAIRRNMKRFKSFYRKHRRQLERDQKIKARQRQEQAAETSAPASSEGGGR